MKESEQNARFTNASHLLSARRTTRIIQRITHASAEYRCRGASVAGGSGDGLCAPHTSH